MVASSGLHWLDSRQFSGLLASPAQASGSDPPPRSNPKYTVYIYTAKNSFHHFPTVFFAGLI
jgi:hypothetical protein